MNKLLSSVVRGNWWGISAHHTTPHHTSNCHTGKVTCDITWNKSNNLLQIASWPLVETIHHPKQQPGSDCMSHKLITHFTTKWHNNYTVPPWPCMCVRGHETLHWLNLEACVTLNCTPHTFITPHRYVCMYTHTSAIINWWATWRRRRCSISWTIFW